MSVITIDAFTGMYGFKLANSSGEPITFVKKEGHVFLDNRPSKAITGMIIDGEYKPWSEIGVGHMSEEGTVRCMRGQSSDRPCTNVRSAADVVCLDMYPVLLCVDHAKAGLSHARSKYGDRIMFRPLQSRLAFELRNNQVQDLIASGEGGMTREQLIKAFSSVKATYKLDGRGGVDFDSADIDMDQLELVAEQHSVDGSKADNASTKDSFFLVGDNNEEDEERFFVFSGQNALAARSEGCSSFPLSEALLYHRNGFKMWEKVEALLFGEDPKGFPIKELVEEIFADLLRPCPGDKDYRAEIWVEYPKALDFKVLVRAAVKAGVLQDGTELKEDEIDNLKSDPLSLIRGNYDGKTVRWHVMRKSLAFLAARILNKAREGSRRQQPHARPYPLCSGLPYQRENIRAKAKEARATWDDLDAHEPTAEEQAKNKRRNKRFDDRGKGARRRARPVPRKKTKAEKQAELHAELDGHNAG